MLTPSIEEQRRRLLDARLMLLFTPELCGARDPLACLEAALPWVDIVQVRIKPLHGPNEARATAEAAATVRWTLDVLARRAAQASEALIVVDDRVDVARHLLPVGVAGVHLGQDDCPPEVARAFLGRDALIGWSTHSHEQLVESDELPIDYVGFGPIHPTSTKGYEHGIGAEAAWIASLATARPLFPIGGIARENVQELARIGRAVVGSAILGAADPGRTARELRELLVSIDDGT